MVGDFVVCSLVYVVKLFQLLAHYVLKYMYYAVLSDRFNQPHQPDKKHHKYITIEDIKIACVGGPTIYYKKQCGYFGSRDHHAMLGFLLKFNEQKICMKGVL